MSRNVDVRYMKVYIKSNKEPVVNINVVIDVLIEADKDAVINPDSQIVLDYEDFIESVTDLITDYYDLHIYYKNNSDGYSHYFGLLAKDDNDNLIIDFDLSFRISSHPEHRSQELKKLSSWEKTKPIVSSIKVNDEEFNNYFKAFEKVDELIGHAVDVMKRSLKYK